MSHDGRCASCGRRLADAGGLQDLCPTCLLRTALARPAVTWRTIGPLGAGPRGPLFLAETDSAHLRLVTVKEVRGGLPDLLDGVLDRLAAIRHPAVLAYLDGRTIDTGDVHLVAGYVVGSSIDVYVRRQHPPAAVRAALVAEVCRAVAAVHRAGLTGGHLTAADVLVTAPGGTPRVVVRDLGLHDVIGRPSDPIGDLRSARALVAGLVPEAARAVTEVEPVPRHATDDDAGFTATSEALERLSGVLIAFAAASPAP